MPASRPRAAFEPIAPDFDIKALVESNQNFSYVDRISCDMIDQQGLAAFEKLVRLHVIIGGKPLVIDGFEDRLDPWTFTPRWLRDNCGEKVENSRNLSGKEHLPLTLGHYLNNMGLLTNQFFEKPGAYKEKNKQRVYLKDIDCPSVWWDKLKEHTPGVLAYLNESTGEIGGPGSVQDGRKPGKGLAPAGDLMSSLPPDMRAENLMCYIGHEGTYTPSHREMCASLGQNIMVEASGTFDEDGKPEKPGSSIWFMTETSDRHLVSEYWLSVLGHDIEVEDHFAQVVAWKKAPFSVYVVEQRPGDFILIPPLAPHQVWNRGTRTMKVAWNRTTVETLRMALDEALPRSRIVCRDEQYKNKAIVYYTLQKYASLLGVAQQQASRMAPEAGHHLMYKTKVRQLQKDFKQLFGLYREILLSEMFNPNEPAPKNIEYLPFDSNVTCAYCRGNIFNRFLSCDCCKDMLGHHADEAEGDPYDVCLDCFAMGRSCWCISGLKWVEQFRWKELASKYETWRKLIISLDGGQVTDKSPLPLIDERRKQRKKTLAEVCKDQLKRRPFKDMHKPVEEPKSDAEDDDGEIVVGDDGMVKKIKKKRGKAWLKNNLPCHVCCHRHATWKMAFCTTCDRGWCYGSLFRGWDKMPLEIMEDPDWKCPHCLGICFAGACKREGKMQSYEPKGTLLGHDTKKVADVRSVEALVDFSVSNLNWLKDDEALPRSQSKRLSRAKADAQKAKENGADIEDDADAEQQDFIDESRVGYEYSPADGTPLDPALGGNAKENEMDDSDAYFARRLQQANVSVPSPAAMLAGAPVSAPVPEVPEGYSPVSTAGYIPPPAHMYGHIDENGHTIYPDPYRPGSVEPMNQGEDASTSDFNKRKRASDDDDHEDIAMSKGKKGKKPRLSAAGFRSVDLADTAPAPPKNEMQRQFGKEKERKALEKAKAEGRFIMMQAALKGKKRIVKFSVPGDRLGHILAAKATQAAELAQAALAAVGGNVAGHSVGSNAPSKTAASMAPPNGTTTDLLTSDIAPKKDPKEHSRELYRQRKEDGHLVTSKTKKALIPVEKDDNYGYRSMEKKLKFPNTAAAKRPGRKAASNHVEYEEVDIGSDLEEEDEMFDPEPNASKRRSIPTYLKDRHNGDEDLPDYLPDDFRDRQWDNNNKRSGVRKSGATAAAESNGLEPAPSGQARPLTGKRPSMRPATASSPHEEDDDVDANSAEFGDEDAVAASTQSSGHATPVGAPMGQPSWTSANKPQSSNSPSAAAVAAAQKQKQKAQRQSAMEEENRRAKLQALQMLDDASPGASSIPPSSSKGKNVRFSTGEHATANNISLADGLDDESSDDEVDSVPAKRGRPPQTR